MFRDDVSDLELKMVRGPSITYGAKALEAFDQLSN